MSDHHSFTSESVSAGHPDKLADQISDALLDALLAQDSESRVAIETVVANDFVLVAGETRSAAAVDCEAVVRQTIVDAGYDREAVGLDGRRCTFENKIRPQSAEIAEKVNASQRKAQGAGDQGMMFGYASDEMEDIPALQGALMPAPIHCAHRLIHQHAAARRGNALPWLRADAKSQVTISYQDHRPQHIDAVVLSTQHDPDVSLAELRAGVREHIIIPALPSQWLSERTQYFINPGGAFTIGGPRADCGLTGRKIIVDTYGGVARHGGGAFSGKDPSKVDRSAAYLCRYIAKNLVAAGLARRCEVQLSYAIGEPEPISVSVNTYGSGACGLELSELVRAHFKLSPAGLIDMLELKRPIYLATATGGHFGRAEPSFSWERTDLADALRSAANRSSAA